MAQVDVEGFVKVGDISSMIDTKPLVIVHDGYKIAIYCVQDQYYAIEDICPHMGAFISNGYQEENLVICPWHNWEFDVRTGECVKPINDSCIKTFPLKIADNGFWLPRQLSEENDGEIDGWF
jgi:nitrite reductase (NADH) small subunit/3-phenylpropionate/trans-cinnamate dioxygenase ferredoxin subunit